MKILLLAQKNITLAATFEIGLQMNGCEVTLHDFKETLSSLKVNVNSHIKRFPGKIRTRWENSYIQSINKGHRQKFIETNPDLVLLYSSEFLSPETIRFFKTKAKVVYYLGDSPFFTPVYERFLECLTLADLILCSDTYWIEQLRMVNINRARFFIPGSNPLTNYRKEVSEQDVKKHFSDIVFVGAAYSGAWGYKRACFLDQFSDLNLKIYTSRRLSSYFHQFPRLKECASFPARRISHEEHNTILNCCKLYPVDANPGIINGVHIRILDCLASGILPLVEHRGDIETVFMEVPLPLIRSYGEAGDLARHFLQNDDLRTSTLEELRDFAQERYTPEKTMRTLLEFFN